MIRNTIFKYGTNRSAMTFRGRTGNILRYELCDTDDKIPKYIFNCDFRNGGYIAPVQIIYDKLPTRKQCVEDARKKYRNTVFVAPDPYSID